jgi:uncharacterized membrane protein (DUF373 family)
MHDDETQSIRSAKIILYSFLFWIQSLCICIVLFIVCQQNYFGIIKKTNLKKLSKKVLEYQIFLDLFKVILPITFLPGQLPPAPTFSELTEFT